MTAGQETESPSGARPSRPAAVVVLIPAFKPDRKLVDLVEQLRACGFRDIIVVDDGSPAESAAIFEEMRSMPGCLLVRHECNRGKGRALKSGLACFLERYPEAAGVVTVDADGQHRAPDVLKVAESFLASPEAFVIGSRSFPAGTPLRSRIGNELTRRVFRWVVGLRLSDTQSGLRCFSRAAAPRLLELAGERYEFEMNVLAACPGLALPFREVGIETVYLDENRSSHFNPLLDSMRIYFLLLRFSASSLLAALVDFLVFAAVWGASSSILASLVAARLVSASLNFLVNRGPVFHSGERGARVVRRYAVLVAVLGALSYFGMRGLVELGLQVLPAKIVAETVLFLASFAVQRDYVFVGRQR
jgi:glycosyltransferase involved in cell wall biosynthesis